MPLTCNIDARGKRARLINGIALLISGVAILLLLAWPTHGPIAWTISIAFILLGGFCVFEARAGWCALRAMGIRTKL